MRDACAGAGQGDRIPQGHELDELRRPPFRCLAFAFVRVLLWRCCDASQTPTSQHPHPPPPLTRFTHKRHTHHRSSCACPTIGLALTLSSPEPSSEMSVQGRRLLKENLCRAGKSHTHGQPAGFGGRHEPRIDASHTHQLRRCVDAGAGAGCLAFRSGRPRRCASLMSARAAGAVVAADNISAFGTP